LASPGGTGLSDDALNAPGAEIPLMKLLALAANLTRQCGAAWPSDAASLWSAPMHGSLEVAVMKKKRIALALVLGR